MKKSIKIVIGIVVLIAIPLGIWLIGPVFYDRQVNEALPGSASDPHLQEENVNSIARGTFTGFDRFHQASGTAHVVQADGKTFIRFEDDFTVSNGPDLYVYLGKGGQYDETAVLGRLKGNVGSQNYEVPADIDLGNYNEVWVWCRAFSVPFGKAVLNI